jgi:fatty acid desaturase
LRIESASPVAEWPTFALLAATYALFALGTTVLWTWSPVLAVAATAIAIAQHSSLQHEALHGHPLRNATLNHLLVFLPIGFFYPYLRFLDTHLAHHHDPILTDPYDDPESNYLDPAVWVRLPRWWQRILRANNTLAGRLLLGPLIGYLAFLRGDLRAIAAGDRRVLWSWVLHAIGLALVLGWLLVFGAMPVWAWLLSCYFGAALLKIRTFLEHRAHELPRARTVLIEDRGPLALLFLNNNLHVVHHMHPAVPWYRLPAMYRENKVHYLRRNDAYVYRSYGEIFRRHLLRAKDPVPHPVWPVWKGGEDH